VPSKSSIKVMRMQQDYARGPTEGKLVHLREIGARFLVRGEETGGKFALVERPI
jgi:hypothetical protein